MVYHGPSRGCQACRKRRVKCDEAHPFCGACVKRKQQHACVYRDPFSAVHKDGNRPRNANFDAQPIESSVEQAQSTEIFAPVIKYGQPSASLVLRSSAHILRFCRCSKSITDNSLGRPRAGIVMLLLRQLCQRSEREAEQYNRRAHPSDLQAGTCRLTPQIGNNGSGCQYLRDVENEGP